MICPVLAAFKQAAALEGATLCSPVEGARQRRSLVRSRARAYWLVDSLIRDQVPQLLRQHSLLAEADELSRLPSMAGGEVDKEVVLTLKRVSFATSGACGNAIHLATRALKSAEKTYNYPSRDPLHFLPYELAAAMCAQAALICGSDLNAAILGAATIT